jgi:hypothetical protein
MKKYLLKMLNIFLFLGITFLPPLLIHYNLIWVTWIMALFLCAYIEDSITYDIKDD